MISGVVSIISFKDFHSRVKEIVEQLCRNEELAVRAAVNPILAIEELGYRLSPEVRKQVERRLRYSPGQRKQLIDLEKQIKEKLNREINLDSDDEIEKILIDDCGLKALPKISMQRADAIEKGKALLAHSKYTWIDPLEKFKDSHPLVPLLIKYRDIQFSKPGFATAEDYEKIKKGQIKLPISSIKIHFPEKFLHIEEVDNA